MEDSGFLEWFNTTWHDAEMALHDGKPGARDDTWSDREPITLFGAWMTATNAQDARAVFRKLEQSFSDAHAERVELLAHGASADLAYTVHREHTTTSVRGEPRDYVLRVTQVYRREDGAWKVVHRHADNQDSEVAP